MSLTRSLVLALAIVSAASAETFQVTWDYIPNTPLDVRVGDIVAFTWLSELHDVYIHPTLDCTETGAKAVYAPATQGTQGGSPTYTFTAEDAAPGGLDMFFASDIGSHCEAYANLEVRVFPEDAGEIFQVTWDFIPNAPLDVKVGDTVAFIWLSELHDVYIHPTLNCTETGAIAVHAPATQGGSPTYTFTAEDALPGGNEMFFASDVGSHCDANAKLAVTVFP
jgi:plastocyanin